MRRRDPNMARMRKHYPVKKKAKASKAPVKPALFTLRKNLLHAMYGQVASQAEAEPFAKAS